MIGMIGYTEELRESMHGGAFHQAVLKPDEVYGPNAEGQSPKTNKGTKQRSSFTVWYKQSSDVHTDLNPSHENLDLSKQSSSWWCCRDTTTQCAYCLKFWDVSDDNWNLWSTLMFLYIFGVNVCCKVGLINIEVYGEWLAFGASLKWTSEFLTLGI